MIAAAVAAVEQPGGDIDLSIVIRKCQLDEQVSTHSSLKGMSCLLKVLCSRLELFAETRDREHDVLSSSAATVAFLPQCLAHSFANR